VRAITPASANLQKFRLRRSIYIYLACGLTSRAWPSRGLARLVIRIFPGPRPAILLTISVVIKRWSRNVTLLVMMEGAPHTLSHTVESPVSCQGVFSCTKRHSSLYKVLFGTPRSMSQDGSQVGRLPYKFFISEWLRRCKKPFTQPGRKIKN
jgi:hypothetical protein